jgi:ABC-2 type transport system ATP-binding protein
VITTSGLTRRFGDVTALDGLTLDLPDAGVVGVVGPNGSGKSTLIRVLLGLVAPTAGTATVLGRPVTEPGAYLDQVGALVESPAFVPGLSARGNLLSLARLRGLPVGRVDEVMAVVGLTGRDREPVRRFSLGMKQRLGIAAALLPDPKLLVLDEPTNGLDPSGIVEIRALLARLAQSGRMVLVSSHQLAEIEAVCDFLVVIRFGRLVYSGSVADLLSTAGQRVEVAPEHDHQLDLLESAFDDEGWQVERAVDGRLAVLVDERHSPRINRVAFRHGITLRVVTPVRGTLEDVFLELTGRSDHDVSAAHAAAGQKEAQ